MIKLIKGDCLQEMKNIPDKSIDAIITDPPYGTTACKWDIVIPFEPMWEQLNRVIKQNGAIVLFGNEPFSSKLRLSNLKEYKYDWYWKKDRASNRLNAKKQPMRNIETISVFNVKQYYPIMEHWGEPSHSVGKKNGKKLKGTTTGDFICVNANIKTNIKYPRTLLEYALPHPKIHPTEKPIALIEYLIKTYTKDCETVLDFTMGSGTTAITCLNTNRSFIGIELDENYFKKAKERVEKHRLQMKMPF